MKMTGVLSRRPICRISTSEPVLTTFDVAEMNQRQQGVREEQAIPKISRKSGFEGNCR
jgi:hypothetical protein